MDRPDPLWSPSQVARNWFHEVWNNRNREAIHSLFVGQAEGLAPGEREASKDPDAYAAMWDVFQEAFDGLTVTPVEIFEHGMRGAVRYRVTGTHKASGKPVTFEGMGTLTVENGRIAEAWNAIDFLSMVVEVSDELPGDLMMRALKGQPIRDASSV